MEEISLVNKRLFTVLTMGLTTAALTFAQPAAVQSPKLLSSINMRVFPHVVDGGLTRSVLIITNSDTKNSAHFHLNFYNDNGGNTQFVIKELGGAVDHVDGTVAAGGAWFLTTSSTSSTNQQGFAIFDSTTASTVGGIQIIQVRSSTNGPFSAEATVEAVDRAFTTPIGVPFDNTGGNVSSMAVASTDPNGPQTVNVSAKDDQGNTLFTGTLSLVALHHTAFGTAAQWPALANKRGMLFFSPGAGQAVAQVAIMALRFASVSNGFTVTALPPIQGF
jgi:hypothetical protein